MSLKQFAMGVPERKPADLVGRVVLSLFIVLFGVATATAETVSWLPDADGQWTLGTNWSSNPALPGATDDVTIAVAGDRLITLSGGTTQAINSLVSDERLMISGSSLVVGTTAQISNALTLSDGGTLRGGAYSATGGAILSVVNGTLDGVTLNDSAEVSANGVATVKNGLVLNGTLSVGKADGTTYGQVNFGSSGSSAGMLSGSGTITLGGHASNNALLNYSDLTGVDGTLTIGAGLTLRGKNGRISNQYATGTIVNQGTISSDVSAGTITIGGTGAMINQGTLSASNGGTITIAGQWSNTGPGLVAVDGGTVNFGGNFTQASVGRFTRNGGTVNVTGTLTGDLALDANTGSWILTSGTIRNGVYSATSGASLELWGGTLDGMTINGPVDGLASASGKGVGTTVKNGLVLNDTLNLGDSNITSYNGQVWFGNTMGAAAGSLTGTGTVVFRHGGGLNNALINRSTAAGAAGTLTIGPNILIRGESGRIENYVNSGTIVNQGTIVADVAGGTLQVGTGLKPGTFTNQGVMKVLNGATLNVAGTWTNSAGASITATDGTLSLGAVGVAQPPWSNAGMISVTNSVVNLGGSFTQAGMGNFTRSGGTVTLTGTLNGDLALNADTGSWSVRSGTISGGAYSATGGASLSIISATLDRATLNSPIGTDGSASVQVRNGLVLNNVLTLGVRDDGRQAGQFFFGDSTSTPVGSLSGTGTIILNGTTPSGTFLVNNSTAPGTAGTLTIGPNILIRGKAGGVQTNPGSIINQGTITADVAGGTIIVSDRGAGAFVNQGTMAADGGNLQILSKQFSNSGVLRASAGGTLQIGNGFTPTNVTFLPGSSLIVNGGTAQVDTNVTVPKFDLSYGGLSGAGNFSTPTFNWTGGAMGGYGKTIVASGATLTLSGNNGKTLRRTIDNSGMTSWTGGVIFADGGGTFNNLASGMFSATAEDLFFNEYGTNEFNNAGSFVKTTPSVTSFGVPFTNQPSGVVNVNGGTLALLAGGMNSGRVNIAAGATLQLGGSFTLWADNQIGNGGALSVVNAGSLLDFGGHSESVGALSITGNAAVAVGATGTASKLGTAVVRATSLTITTGGKLDLANNRLIVDYGGDSPITSIRTALSTGYAGGAWNGPGILSSAGIANPTRALGYGEANDILSSSGGTFAGQNVDGTAVLIGYTLAGDTNLDGAVDFSDLVRLAQNYNVTDGTRVWANGDFNYDGSVDFADLVKLAQNYNSALPGEPIADAPTGFKAELARAFASVPEPNALTVVAFGSFLMKRRRR